MDYYLKFLLLKLRFKLYLFPERTEKGLNEVTELICYIGRVKERIAHHERVIRGIK